MACSSVSDENALPAPRTVSNRRGMLPRLLPFCLLVATSRDPRTHCLNTSTGMGPRLRVPSPVLRHEFVAARSIQPARQPIQTPRGHLRVRDVGQSAICAGGGSRADTASLG